MTTAEVLTLLERLREDGGAQNVFFSGGEPLARRDFPRILDAACELGLGIEVITNGTVLSEGLLASLVRNGVRVNVSVDGARAETHDAVRGRGRFARTLETLAQLVGAGIDTAVTTTVIRANFDELGAIAALARERGVQRVSFSEVVRGGRARDHWDELALTSEQRGALADVVRDVAAGFGDEGLGEDDHCWVDGSSCYIDATGRAYLCSEIFQQAPEQALADARSEGGINTLLASLRTRHSHRACCYQVLASEHVSLMRNLERPCALVDLWKRKDARSIDTLDALKRELGELWTGISRSCAKCTDPDCLGYVWVFPEEEDALLSAGVQTVEVNGPGGPLFLDCYERDAEGALVVDRPQPTCPYRAADGRCSVHAVRPLVCHLYPLGPETEPDGRVVWALHTDCRFVRTLRESHGEEVQVRKIRRLLDRITPALRERILEIYKGVDAVSALPDGSNNYVVIQEV
jgi:pyruvate-formate lyase-activating enzyme/Fe-S-cluster containining protein